MCRFDLVASRFLHPNAATRCSLVRGNPAVCITMNDLPNMRHASEHGKLEIGNWKLFTTCAGKLDRLLSLGPLYFAIHDL
jgi:hypothetical protein